MSARGRRWMGLALALALGAAGPARANGLAFDFDFLAYPGADVTRIAGVLADGTVIGSFTVYEDVPFPLPVGESPQILDQGHFRYDGVDYERFDIPDLSGALLSGVNDAGVGWGYADEGSFVYDGGVATLIADPGFDRTFVGAVDGAGAIYGIRGNDDPNPDPDTGIGILQDVSPYVLDPGGFSDFTLPGASYAYVDGARLDGLLWGESDLGAFLYDGMDITLVDAPGDELFNLIFGVSDAGLVALSQFTDTSHDLLYDGVTFQPFEVPGASFSSIGGMNGAGVVWGGASQGAFVATPVPEPSTAALLSLGLGLLAARRRTAPSAGLRAPRRRRRRSTPDRR